MESPELPIEIIIYILKFLQVHDRKEASLVCKRWHVASQDSQFQKNLTFKLPASLSSLDVVRGLARLPHCGLVISHLDGSAVSRAVLTEVGRYLGSRLQSLSLPGSSITESSLLALLPQLTALRRLDLRGLDSLFMSGAFLSQQDSRLEVQEALRHLEELDLSDLRYLSDLTFNRLTGCTPHLRRLSLAGCHIAFEFDPYRGCPVGPDSSAMLSLRNLLKLLQKQAGTVRGLDLSRTGITPESLKSLSKIEGLRLEELHLQGCKELTDQALITLCKYQPALKTLDLSSCTELTNATAQAVASGLKDLQHLHLARVWRVTDKGLSELMMLQYLQTLDLSECIHVSGVDLLKGLQSPSAAASLVALSFRDCCYVRDISIFSLAQLLGPYIRKLDLTSCQCLTDLSVQAIATYLPSLLVLRLGGCKEITDWGLLGMVDPATEFGPDKDLEVKGPSFTRTFGNMGFFRPPPMPFVAKPRLVTEDDLKTFREQEGVSLLALRGLQELDLSGCSKLTDTSITQVLRFPDLQRLSLSMLSDITDQSLLSVGWHCRSLISLNLSYCPLLTDQGIVGAAPFLRRLWSLQLAGCSQITDKSLAAITQHCQSLRTLDISVCKGVTMTAVEQLQSHLPFLDSVNHCLVGGANPTFIL
ncbi:F-box/LRR-repeat protein 2 isoform X1 [Brienomyrus brachyistius]|uniref:F-box/LRR-repeat protein 2 isoform X1 n=1 Tax=Brienomyrus brachyistius TaxID=42636 RepID=UPI0020B3B241|nr:F-box/LRR-repeat protein 2 isoform X1 [Brienomyrus brachyistius]